MRLDDSNDVNVEDQRGGNYSSAGFGGGGGGLGIIGMLVPFVFSRFGCGGLAVLGVVFFLFGGLGSLGSLVAPSGTTTAPHSTAASGSNAAESCAVDAASRFSCNVLASVNQTWAKLIQGYQPPKLVFYAGNGQSGCGAAQAAMGPFYCPSDQGVYLDTSFYNELKSKFGAPGDFAQAYVVAHEVGHHVQTLTGISEQVSRQQARASRSEGNALQVKMELQADCYAGVWAANNRDRMEPGDVEEGMRAAQGIGDDTLQKAAGQRPVPDSFTHGSSAQRQLWLKRGLDSGDPRQCDTFSAG
ncbi:MAG: neutral zinc metallopeptidase [Sphingomonadales bacterium]